MTQTLLRPLTVADSRSRFITVGLGWRVHAARHEQAATSLRQAVADTERRLRTAAAWTHWSFDPGAVRLTAALPADAATPWLQRVLASTAALGRDLVRSPAVALVGNESDLEAASGAVRDLPGIDHWPARELPSRMHQRAEGGFEQVVVTGADPVSEVGGAAVFLAICLVAGGPETFLPAALSSSGSGAVLQLARGLHDWQPGITWQLVAPEHGSSQALDEALAALRGYRVADHRRDEDRARCFALANLNRAWRSPVELAQAMTHYETMGWGGALILDPQQQLSGVDDESLDRAVQLLMRPLHEVRGAG